MGEMGKSRLLLSLRRKGRPPDALEFLKVASTFLSPLLRAVGFRGLKQNTAYNIRNGEIEAAWYNYNHLIRSSAFWHRNNFTQADLKDTQEILDSDFPSVGDSKQRKYDGFDCSKGVEHPKLSSSGDCNATNPRSVPLNCPQSRGVPHIYSERNAEDTLSTCQDLSALSRIEGTFVDYSKERFFSPQRTELKAFIGDSSTLPKADTIFTLAPPRDCLVEDLEGLRLGVGNLSKISEQAAAADDRWKYAVNNRHGEGSQYERPCKTGESIGPVGTSGLLKSEPVEPFNLSNPYLIFQALLASEQLENMPTVNRELLQQILERFSNSVWVSDQALRLNISSSFFPVAVSYFQQFLLRTCTPELLEKLADSCAVNEFIFPIFTEFCIKEFPVEMAKLRAVVQSADLTKPHTWFPSARSKKRKFIYHSGPTNSGKTYTALNKLMEASSGIYCGPLRLLAMEVYDNVNAQGVLCSLLTGQEKRDVPFANHLSCTIEMASSQQEWEVAVIDEIQLLTDEFRGCAWTRALLGLQASEIHLCGDPSALDLVRSICATTGDDLEEKVYERFTSLFVDNKSLEGNFCNIQGGDCIVAFSRKDVFRIKSSIERATSNRCCVVYGALPPETRAQQAKLFNDPNSGYDVLVATDAVGMGLNLNIRRVVFYTLHKFNGDQVKPVSPSQVKQIAGRAGRRGSLFPEGIATTFYPSDLFYLVKCMREPFSRALSAGLFPLYEHMELFSAQLSNLTFSQLLDQFGDTCRVDGLYFLCRYDNFQKVAYLIDKIKGLTLEDRLNLCFAPVNTRDAESMEALLSYAQSLSQKLPARLLIGVPTESAKNDRQLLDLESKHQLVSLYLWLSQHFSEEYFPDKDEAEEIAANITLLLGESLAMSHKHKTDISDMLSSVLEIIKGRTDRSAPPEVSGA